MAKKLSTQQTTQCISRFNKEVKNPLKTLSNSSQKLLDKYRQKNFEYISFKDFKNLLSTLEQMSKQINACYQSAQNLTGTEQIKIKDEASAPSWWKD